MDEKMELTKESYNGDNDCYSEFLVSLKEGFNNLVKTRTPLFTTNAEGLFELFLDNLPVEARQHYTCRTCMKFIERFANLVILDENGEMQSVLTSDVPDFFKESINAMRDAVLKSIKTRVNGIFVTKEAVLGKPTTDGWNHMSFKLPSNMVYTSRLKDAHQEICEKSEDYRILNTSLQEYPIEIVEKALELLRSEALYRSEKCLGVAEWLLKLHKKRNEVKSSKNRNHIVWLAVATAPSGFCHIRSSMIGTLLDDIVSGLSYNSIRDRFAEKMNPSNYMRSQTPPSSGGILEAERIVEKMGIAESLKRRYAKFEEIPYFRWTNQYQSQNTEAKTKGVFGNITPKGVGNNSDKVNLPSAIMTWDKFQKTILPTAENIEAKIENTNRLMALVTASNEDAPGIFQWNNSFSWYYHGGIDGEIKRRVENAGGKYENNEIRCSLIWEGYTDLDIHCITPRREHINFSNKKSRCGGWLDIDMNGGPHRDSSPVENVRWSSNAPEGKYSFFVHNYCERGKGTTPFTVELEVNGKIYTYNGVAGSTNFKTDVFTFNYVKGQQPVIDNSNSYSSCDKWNIPMNEFVKVKAITTSPNLWGENPVEHSGNHTFFILDGCKDLSEGKGRGFFSEILKPELRQIRKTLEAYTENTPIENIDEASACGIGFTNNSEWNLSLRVTSNNSTRTIKIDRWD